jgi:glycerophosphoryl diester phosphodiesterase
MSVAPLFFLLLLSGCATTIDLQGHRGARGLHPENTLEGFVAALAIGVTTLELDVGVTADDVVVVHHNEQLNGDIARASGAWIETRPALRELTFAQLQAYEVGRLKPGSDYAKRFTSQRGADGIRIPRLVDVFAMAESKSDTIRYNVETKLSPLEADKTLRPAAFADALIATLRAARVTERTTIQSFDWRTLKHVQAVAPDIATACLTAELDDFDTLARGEDGPSPWTAGLDVDNYASVAQMVAAAGCDVWSPSHRNINSSLLGQAHALGISVSVWTVNEPSDIEAMLELGVDAIISDYPDRVRQAMVRRGMVVPPRF